jgi:hypothetical protein
LDWNYNRSFFVGIGTGYIIYENKYNPATMMQDPQIMNQWMGSMMQNQQFQQNWMGLG